MAAVRSVSGIRRGFLLFPSRTRRKSNRAPFTGDKVTSANSNFRGYPILRPVFNIRTAISFNCSFDKYSLHCASESSDILLHLVGVNDYRGLCVVGDAIWKTWGGSHQFDGPHGS